jgi:phage protein D
METPEVQYEITINGHSATKDLRPFVKSITYTDHIHGVADELVVNLDNTDRRFSNDWYMSPGMLIGLKINSMDCGQFTVDDTDRQGNKGAGHTANFSAQSAGYTHHIRSKNSFTHEGKKLGDLVKHYAKKHKKKHKGKVPDLTIGMAIQNSMSDIAYLQHLASLYGCIMSLKGDILTFQSIEEIWKAEAAKKLVLTDDMTYLFKNCLTDSPDGVINSYNDPYKEKVVGTGALVSSFAVDIKQNDPRFQNTINATVTPGLNNTKFEQYMLMDEDYQTASNIVHLEYHKTDSPEEGQRVAVGKVMRGQLAKHTGSILMPGDEEMVAGNLIDIQEVGKDSGLWLIDTSIHHITGSGAYDTFINIKHSLGSSNRSPARKPEKPNINRPHYLDDVGRRGLGKNQFTA